MQGQPKEELHSNERVKRILGRVQLIGGLPPTKAYTDKLSTWFRALAAKGYTSADFMSDPDRVRTTFEASFLNPGTRSQYIKSFLKYLSGLTEEEYLTEYPSLERRAIVSLLHSITRRASEEIRAAKQARLEGEK